MLFFMKEPQNICILGSTGSIGRSSLEVVSRSPERFRVRTLSANRNVRLLLEQIEKFQPEMVAVFDRQAAAELRNRVNGNVKVLAGAEGLGEIVAHPDVDLVINSLVGFAGLRPTIDAITHGKTVALANKESLVVAGRIITELLSKHGAALIPIDSEHSAILQCLMGEQREHVARLILTASGGPFLHRKKEEFPSLTVDAALVHPTWRMGRKITIDSATLMNKGLEVIEAHWLFGLSAGQISVLIHPQSIIHSMVEFVDGSIKAQLGVPDMKIPIQFALSYPERIPLTYGSPDFAEIGEMTFFAPDMEKFECLGLAYEALRAGGTAPAVLNAANEVAVELFLAGNISFDRIPALIRDALHHVPILAEPQLEEIIAADSATRAHVRKRHAALSTERTTVTAG